MKRVINFIKRKLYNFMSWISISLTRIILILLTLFIILVTLFYTFPGLAFALFMTCILMYYLFVFGYLSYNIAVFAQEKLSLMFPKYETYEIIN